MKFKSLIKSHWPWLLILAHVIKVGYWFRRIDWTSPYPILNFDYVQYYARALRADIFLTRADRFWGYDPYQMAGYISGPFLAVGTYLFSFISHALRPALSIGQSLLYQEVLFFFLMPFLLWTAVVLFGGTRKQAWVSFGFVTLAFGGIEAMTGHLIYVGLFGYQMACFVGVLQVALVWKWIQDRSLFWWSVLVVVSSLLFQVHPAALLIVGPANLFLLILCWRQLRRQDGVFLALGVALVTITNLYWIHPFVTFSHWMDQAPYFISGGGRQVWDLFSPFQPTWVEWGRVLFYWACLWLAWGAIQSFAKKEPTKSLFFKLWVGWLFLLSFFGSDFPLFKSLQPARVLIGFWLVLWMLVGFSFDRLIGSKPDRRAGFLFFAGLLALVHFTRPSATQWNHFSNTLSPSASELIAYLKEDGPRDSRILIGSSDAKGIHMGDLIPLLTNRSVLGGPHPGNFIKPNQTLFAEMYNDGKTFIHKHPKMFNQSLLDMTEEELSVLLRQYNVGMIVAQSRISRSQLNLFTSLLTPVHRIGRFGLYEVNQERSWFVKGQAQLEAGYDAIKLSQIESDELVLKFHWSRVLKADPPVKMEPVRVEGAALPFIRIYNPKEYKEIRLAHTPI